MTQAKQITNLLLFNNFLSSDIVLTSSRGKESDELLCTVSVTRYGPQSAASASG